jgi:hypothetical protein
MADYGLADLLQGRNPTLAAETPELLLGRTRPLLSGAGEEEPHTFRTTVDDSWFGPDDLLWLLPATRAAAASRAGWELARELGPRVASRVASELPNFLYPGVGHLPRNWSEYWRVVSRVVPAAGLGAAAGDLGSRWLRGDPDPVGGFFTGAGRPDPK